MLNEFNRFLEKQRMSEKTIYEYIRALDRFFKWYAESNDGDLKVEQLLPGDLERYASHLLHNKKFSPAYVNKNLSALRKWLFFLQTKGLWPYAIDLPDVKYQSQHVPKSLEPQEVRAILYAVEQEKNDMLRARDRCMIYMALYRGLRNEDLMLLDIDDVIITPGRECIIIRQGKGNKYAEIDIRTSRKIILSIQEWCQERAKSAYASSPRFFISQKSGKVTWGAINRMVNRIIKRSGVEFTMHQLRHTFAHDVLKITDNIRLVQEMLRHSDVKTTEIYTKQRSDEIFEAFRKLDQLY